jgi:shikimate kinase
VSDRRACADATGGSHGSGAARDTARTASVVLVGFMGAGKSAVGRELAEALGVPFVDTDDLVVAKAGPIAAIFADRGEAGFRALEAGVVTAALAAAFEEARVLALGGGAVLSEAVRRTLSTLPHVVWLKAPPEELWARIAREGLGSRPLAADERTFRALLAAREPLYREVATEVVETAGRSACDVAADLASGPVAGGRDATRRRGDGGAR